MRDTNVPAPALSLFALVGCVLLFGIVMLGSATAPVGQERFGSAYYFLWRQVVFGLIPGLALFFLLRRISVARWEQIARSCWWITIGLLLLVFIPGLGVRINNSLSWVNLGMVTVQPAEIAKLTFVIFLSWFLTKRQADTWGYLGHVGIVCALLVVQPDVGTMVVFFATAMIMLFVAGGSIKHLGLIATVGVGALALLIAIAPYRLQRITVLFNPDADPYGSGYHLKQSFVALGSGGLFGLGLGNSRQKFQYLPEVSADSIFAVIGEELGFLISVLLIAAYGAIILKGYTLAKTATSPWGKLLVVGTMSWIGAQTALNIGAMVGLVPLTGLPLPLISHGGSALMMTLASFGVVASVVAPAALTRRVRI